MRSSKLIVNAAPFVSSSSASPVSLLIQPRGFQVRNMGVNPNDVKKRIKSTQSIAKITKSMKMVSASKFRGDQTRLEKGKTFGRGMLSLYPEKAYSAEDPVQPEPKAKKSLVVVISSDKGLCGGINSFATKMAKSVMDVNTKKGIASNVVVVGGKSEGQLRRTHGSMILCSIDECWKQPMNFAVASGMASEIISAAKAANADEVSIVYNSFKSMIKYLTTVQRVPNWEAQMASAEGGEAPEPLNRFELEPDSTEECVQNLYEFSMATTLYGICLDNACSEQSSRMQAMENATKNANEMISKLLLVYNRARQSKITTELIEIISGAESLKG